MPARGQWIILDVGYCKREMLEPY